MAAEFSRWSLLAFRLVRSKGRRQSIFLHHKYAFFKRREWKEWRGRTQKFALYSFPTDIKCFPSAEANDLFPLLILWTQDCGFPSSYFRILYSLINFQIFPQQTKGCRPGRNTRRILATRVALCTNLRPHLPTVATSSDKQSTRQQAFHSSHHPITR